MAENYVTNCCGAGADFILFRSGAEFYFRCGAELLVMRIRSRILWGFGAEFYEDPEPNYYFCINDNNLVIIFIFRIRSRIIILSIIIIILLILRVLSESYTRIWSWIVIIFLINNNNLVTLVEDPEPNFIFI